jgi:hypothetical protein
VYSLLPNKETSSYSKIWAVICFHVKYKDSLANMVMSDFEKGVMNTLSWVFPNAQVCKKMKLYYIQVI